MIFLQLARRAFTGVLTAALMMTSVNALAAENLLAQIKERGTLRVGLEGTYPPFSFQDENGKLAGFEVEFAEQLAKHMNLKADLKPTK